MSKAKTTKRCPRCCPVNKTLPVSAFNRNSARGDGLDGICRDCTVKQREVISAKNNAKADRAAERIIRDTTERAARMASDHDALKIEDFDPSGTGDAEYDVSVGNVKGQGRVSASASRHKRQEFNASMGANAETLKRAGATAHQRGGDVLSAMSGESGAYIGKLAEQERRFGNRRMARTISLAQAQEALALQHMKQIADQFFRDKITATGFGRYKPDAKAIKRSTVLLLSDLHLGAELSSLDEPMPFRANEEARRLEHILRETIDFKTEYRKNSECVLLLNGDLIEGQLLHQIGAGSPLAEQKATFWAYFRRFVAELSRAFPRVRVYCQPGNHGRDKVRHPGRATWRKWDGHEWEMMYALAQMCAGLHNVTFDVPFRAVSAIDLHGSILGMSHGDTEIKLGHPDKAAEKNARMLDRLNAAQTWQVTFDAFAFGHFHTGRVMYGDNMPVVFNGALVPPNGHARSEGYISEAMGQFLWEAVAGFPVGDVRFLKVGPAQDRDARLGKIIQPFRFPLEHI